MEPVVSSQKTDERSDEVPSYDYLNYYFGILNKLSESGIGSPAIFSTDAFDRTLSGGCAWTRC